VDINRAPHGRRGLTRWTLLVSFALVIGAAFQGSRGLYETTEGRYAEVAREMMETGNYLEPSLGYRPHWTKPPLAYWAIAGGMRILGRNAWGARLCNVVAFVLTVVAVACIGKTLWGMQAGFTAGIIYASSGFPALAASELSADTLLTMWEVGAVLCYVKAVFAGRNAGRKRWISAMWVFWGLGFLTKGPPALLPLIPILLWHARFRRSDMAVGRLFQPLGILLFVSIGFSWYIVEMLRHPGLWRYWLGHEVLGRVATKSFNRNPQWYKPFVIYLPVLTTGAGPWLYFGIKVIARTGIWRWSALRAKLRAGGPAVLLLLWVAIPLGVFCISQSRLPLYVLPLYAPVSLAMARGISKFLDSARVRRQVAIVAVCAGVFLVGIKGGASLYPTKLDMKSLYQLCRGMKGAHSRFYAFDEKRLFGLQFYLEGNLARVSESGYEPWADESLDAVIASSRRLSAQGERIILIAKRKRLAFLQNALESAGVPFDTGGDKYWVLFSVGGVSGISGGDS